MVDDEVSRRSVPQCREEAIQKFSSARFLVRRDVDYGNLDGGWLKEELARLSDLCFEVVLRDPNR